MQMRFASLLAEAMCRISAEGGTCRCYFPLDDVVEDTSINYIIINRYYIIDIIRY